MCFWIIYHITINIEYSQQKKISFNNKTVYYYSTIQKFINIYFQYSKFFTLTNKQWIGSKQFRLTIRQSTKTTNDVKQLIDVTFTWKQWHAICNFSNHWTYCPHIYTFAIRCLYVQNKWKNKIEECCSQKESTKYIIYIDNVKKKMKFVLEFLEHRKTNRTIVKKKGYNKY